MVVCVIHALFQSVLQFKMTHILIIFIAVLVVSKSIEAQTASNYPAEFAEALEVDLFAKINTGRITNLLS